MLGFLTNCIELLLNPKFTIPVIGGVVGFFILLHLLWKISDMAEQKREEKTSETYTDLLSDDVLNKRLDPPMKIFEPISFSPDIELTLTPFQSTPTKEQPMISEEEYISQLENLYREHGNNAFHYVTRIQEQTGYSKDKIKADLKKIRSQIDAISSPKYLLGTPRKPNYYYPNATKQTISREAYISQLEDLYRKFGDNAFQHLSDIQKRTGYNRKKVENDLAEVRLRLLSKSASSTTRPQSNPIQLSSQRTQKASKPSQLKPKQSTPSAAQKANTPPQSQPKPATPTPTPKAPPEHPKAPSKPNLSIEEQLVNYLKAQPVQWDYPLRSNNEALKTICNIAVRSNGATATITDEVLENLELSIQKKRARNPRLADHNAAMEGNILAMLYEYSYLMQMFHAIYTLDFDTTQVDIQKLWVLIQTDCNARIDNLAAEKRKNPAIQATLDKYRYDNQITKLRVLNDATGREMDYIISFIMDYGLLSVMNFLLGNTKLLLTLRAFPIDDVIAMMDSFITTDATIRFTAYSR